MKIITIFFFTILVLVTNAQVPAFKTLEIPGRALLGFTNKGLFYRMDNAVYLMPKGERKGQKIFSLNEEQNACKQMAISENYLVMIGGANVYVYDWISHKLIWTVEYDYNYPILSCQPQIYGDYFTISYEDQVMVYNLKNGNLEFLHEDDDLECDMTIIGDKVFFSYFDDAIVCCYDFKKNKKLWSKCVGLTTGFGVADDGDRVILPSWNANLFSVDINSGKEYWEIDMNDEITGGCGSGFEEAPAIYGGELFVPHREEGLYVFDKKTGQLNKHLKLDDFIVGGAVVYREIIWFAGETTVFGYCPKEKRLKYQHKMDDEYPGDIYLADGQLLIEDYDSDRKATRFVVVDLDMLMVK